MLSDCGTRDWYVASIKAVILSHAPGVHVVDITHEVPPQDVMAGAFTLAAAAPWFPPRTVFLGVVDPGVGSARAIVAAQADDRWFIGPDNGLLSLCFQRAKRLEAVQVTNRRYWLDPVSPTFHGRDIMAPVAAYLVRGGSLRQLGLPARRTISLEVPTARRRSRTIDGRIVHVDAFGNLVTNVPGDWVSLRQHPRHRIMIRCAGRVARMVSSYAAVEAGQLVALIGSLGFVELAVCNGSATRVLNAARGDPVVVTWSSGAPMRRIE